MKQKEAHNDGGTMLLVLIKFFLQLFSECEMFSSALFCILQLA